MATAAAPTCDAWIMGADGTHCRCTRERGHVGYHLTAADDLTGANGGR